MLYKLGQNLYKISKRCKSSIFWSSSKSEEHCCPGPDLHVVWPYLLKMASKHGQHKRLVGKYTIWCNGVFSDVGYILAAIGSFFCPFSI